MQTFIKTEVDEYVVGKQTEMNSYVDGKKTEIVAYSDNTKTLFDAKVNELVDKGEYVPTTQYRKFNMVSLDGNMYMAKSDTLGNAPTNTFYWFLVARKGGKGDPGIGLTFRGTYDGNTNYNTKDAVTLNGVIYYCISPVLGFSPPDAIYWTVFLDTSNMMDAVGDLTELLTVAKSNVVSAINELNSNKANNSRILTDVPENANLQIQ